MVRYNCIVIVMSIIEEISKKEADFLLSEEYKIKKRALVEKIVRDFISNLFGKNKDAILSKWFQYPLSDDVNHIEPFRYVLETILLKRFDFSIHPTYIEIFQDMPELKIRREILDRVSSKAISFMETDGMTYFKTQDTERSILPSVHFRSFFFNKMFEDGVNRMDLVIRIIYNILINAIESDNTYRLFGTVRRFIVMTLDTIVADQYQKMVVESRGKRSAKKRSKKDDRIFLLERILEIQTYLTNERLVFEKLLPQCRFRF